MADTPTGEHTADSDARLRDRIQEAVTTAINSVYGTDDRHAYMGWRIASNVVNGRPLPWTYVIPPAGCPTCGHPPHRHHERFGCMVETGDSGSGSVADAVFCKCVTSPADGRR